MKTNNNNRGESILKKITALEKKKRYTISYNNTDKSKTESFEERIKTFGFEYKNGEWYTNALIEGLDFKKLVGELKRIKKFILANEGIIKVTMKTILDGEETVTI